jgi:hypothetical protein
VKRIPIASIALLATGLALAPPALAQDEKINQLIVYGDDPCPPSTDDQITVCARKDESERYRIPEPLRESVSPQNEAWNNRVIAYETVGKTGTHSCSPVGPGGSTGCTIKMIEAAMAERESDPSLRFSELIAEERARRLATIEAEAEEQQARVEEEERRYFERQRQAEEGDGIQSDPATDSPAGSSADLARPPGE